MRNRLLLALGVLCLFMAFGMFSGCTQRVISFSGILNEMFFVVLCCMLSAACFLTMKR